MLRYDDPENPTVGLGVLPRHLMGLRMAGMDTAHTHAVGPETLRHLRDSFSRFMLTYQSGINELETKVTVLQEEFRHVHRYNPIEHVSSRLKSPESLVDKVARKGIDPTFEAIGESIHDIAGVRVTCSFVSDVHRVFNLLTAQPDVHVVEVKDYITHPKPNGYRSLHGILDVPVFFSSGEQVARIELQVRTIAMDFWASLEHKIFYKYRGEVPSDIQTSLTEAARTAAQLDRDMERLHRDIHGDPNEQTEDDAPTVPPEALARLMALQQQLSR